MRLEHRINFEFLTREAEVPEDLISISALRFQKALLAVLYPLFRSLTISSGAIETVRSFFITFHCWFPKPVAGERYSARLFRCKRNGLFLHIRLSVVCFM